MKIYHYHPDTYEYLGETEARLDPLETLEQGTNVYLIPANATDSAPPGPQAGHARVFVNNTWQVLPDNRGTIYYKADGAEVIIEQIGEEVPVDALVEPPEIAPPQPAPSEILIRQKLRAMAIDSLKQEGKLPAEYTDPTLGV